MTRYARGKGSKASNEKMPNEATPWHVLKQQLNEKLSNLEHTKKPKSAKELLQDKDLFYFNVGNVNNDWAEFEQKTVKKDKNPITKKIKKLKETSLDKAVNSNETKGAEFEENTVKKIKNPITKKSKKLKETSFDTAGNSNENKKDEDNGNFQKKLFKKRNINEINTSKIDVSIKKCKKDLLPKSNNNVKKEEEGFANQYSTKENVVIEKGSTLNKEEKQNGHKLLETSLNSNNISQTNINEINISNADTNLSVTDKKKGILPKHSIKQQKKSNMHSKNNNSNINQNNENNYKIHKSKKIGINRSNSYKFGGQTIYQKGFENNNKKPAKVRDDKVHKRRKPEIGSTKIIINGMEIELTTFDGFPVRKEDADRLRELKQKMIMKGIPIREVNIAMKLERRRAEKALARIRKSVCFHCRKAGHNLSDCPELGSEQSTGICFKCGSTEHTHFECKVAKPTEFRYATCFICREEGHISRQCPDNPKGIYPRGGSCKLCGDVTHLKKDCPNFIKEKEEATITVNTIADGNIEHLEGSTKTVQAVENKKPKRVVKF